MYHIYTAYMTVARSDRKLIGHLPHCTQKILIPKGIYYVRQDLLNYYHSHSRERKVNIIKICDETSYSLILMANIYQDDSIRLHKIRYTHIDRDELLVIVNNIASEYNVSITMSLIIKNKEPPYIKYISVGVGIAFGLSAIYLLANAGICLWSYL